MKLLQNIRLVCFLCFFGLCYSPISSQDSFFTIGDKFTYSADLGWSSVGGVFQYEVVKDTTILGFPGHIVTERKHGSASYFQQYYFYQDNDKVYLGRDQSSILLYDFGAAAGDTMNYENVYSEYQEIVILSVGDTVLNDKPMKYQIWARKAISSPIDTVLVLEKIGIVGRYNNENRTCSNLIHIYGCSYSYDGINYYFQCYQSDDYSYYREEPCLFNSLVSDTGIVEKDMFYPNPTLGDISVNLDIKFHKIIVFNHNGQKIKELTDSEIKNFQIEEAGLYTIYVIGDKGTYFQKLLVYD